MLIMATKQEKRIASFDLMRVILSIMVIALHFNNSMGGKGFIYTSANGGDAYEILLFVESVSACAVNCFMMLSGFFLCSNNSRCIRKPIFFMGAVICYNTLFYCIDAFINNSFSIATLIRQALPINYFVWLYCTVYIISPWINLCLERLDREKFLLLVKVIMCLFVIWPTITGIYSGITGTVIQQISTISSVDHGSGYTLVQFIVSYILGAYLRKCPIKENVIICLGIYFLNVITTYVFIHFTMAAIDYCNIFVVMAAFFLTATFSKLGCRENLLINKLAGVSFDVYLVHCLMFDLWDWLPIELLEQVSSLYAILIVSVAIILMYIVSVIVSIISKKLMEPVKEKISVFLTWKYTV